MVMYQGKILEQNDTEPLWAEPKHSYTRQLLEAIPLADPRLERARIAAANQ
jgi:ABC-type dipeptide/oligopeptide/nickel transport system ATPase component